MSDQTLRLIAGVVLLAHGLGHGGALGAFIWIRARPGTDTGGWRAARSWLLPDLAPDTAMLIASACWIVALVGFVLAAVSFSGLAFPDAWRPLAVGCAIVSLAGIGLFAGTWPLFNTVAAVAVNVAVLVAVLVLRWPGAAPLA